MPADRVVLVTGASSGIGEAIARGAAAAGHRVVLAARSAERVEALAAGLGGPDRALADELGGESRALAVACDVTEWDDQEALAERTLEAFGRIDVVFANAGFGAKRGFLEETPEFWRSMVLTNVLGVAYTIRATLPALRDNAGHMIITSSLAGRRALPGSLYSASKHAVTAMGEALRQEVNGTGMRVTLIEPGMVDTPFFDNPVDGGLTADDIARAVMYALDEPAHVDVNEILIRPINQPT